MAWGLHCSPRQPTGRHMEDLRQLAHTAAPYVLVELLLPGGSLVALLLYLYRRTHAGVQP